MTKKEELSFEGMEIPMPNPSDNIYTGFEYGIDTRTPHHLKYKDSHLQFEVMGGERVFAYDDLTRKIGLRIFIIGIISTIFWIYFLFK